jgi:thiamine-phosphate pyrophosphorylase
MNALFDLPVGQQPAIYRILDANLDRAREGLRIIEEWCRFGLGDRSLAAECKNLRQELASWHSAEIRLARDTVNDVGTELSHPQEERRQSLEDLLQANFCRVQEALRVLEEYGKLDRPQMALACKQMRYRVYTIESKLTVPLRHQQLQNALLYLVTSMEEDLLETIETSLQNGLTLVQYRDKEGNDTRRWENTLKIKQLCQEYGALFIVNDRVDLALAVDADGVHLGQQDVPISIARELLGKQKIIGRSTTNKIEMQQAIAEGADYIGVGPVYETPTKAGKAPAGLEYVTYAAANSPIPWFAIGGIDTENLKEVLGAGAERVAVVRAITQADRPAVVTQYFISQLKRAQTLRRLDDKI